MERIHRSRFAMGTQFEVVLRGDDAENLEAIAETILDEVLRVERLLTVFDSRSEVSRLHREAAKSPTLVDYELLHILLRCQEAWKLTNGHFDITCGRSRPDANDRRSAAGMRGVHVDSVARTVFFADSFIRLDFGGVGKGYALERAARILDEFHIDHALLHGGTSSILARGDADEDCAGKGWSIKAPAPADAYAFEPESILLHQPPSTEMPPPPADGRSTVQDFWLRDESLSCSMTKLSWNDISDIIDARTGEPLSGLAVCWVIGPSPVETEFLSTAFLSMGKATAVDYISAMSGRADIRIGWFDPQHPLDWLRPESRD